MTETIDHPAHYGGADNPYEAIKVIEAWGLGFKLGNALKYILRAPRKGVAEEDLRKARWYLDRARAFAEMSPAEARRHAAAQRAAGAALAKSPPPVKICAAHAVPGLLCFVVAYISEGKVDEALATFDEHLAMYYADGRRQS
jgi:hypothetical protein